MSIRGGLAELRDRAVTASSSGIQVRPVNGARRIGQGSTSQLAQNWRWQGSMWKAISPSRSRLRMTRRSNALPNSCASSTRPELRHDEVRVDVGEPARADGAQEVDADDAGHEVGVDGVHDASAGATVSSSSSRPPAAWRTRPRPVQIRLRPTSAATSGSSHGRPVSSTRQRPTAVATLVQKSVRTCVPSATRVSESMLAAGLQQVPCRAPRWRGRRRW